MSSLFMCSGPWRTRTIRMEDQVNKGLNTFSLAFGILGLVISILVAFIFIDNNRKVYYMASIAGNNMALRIFFIAFEFFQISTNLGVAVFYILSSISYISIISAMLRQIKYDQFTEIQVFCTTLANGCVYRYCRWESTLSANKEAAYRKFLHLSLLNKYFVASVYPFVLPGHKVIGIPMSIASCYYVLYNTHTVFEKPKVYGFVFGIMLGGLGFELTYFYLVMNIYRVAHSSHNYFLRMNWAKQKVLPSRHFYTELPRREGPFDVYRDLQPSLFLANVAKATIKLRFYNLR